MLYLKGLLGIQEYLQSPDNQQVLECNIFNMDWDISKKAKNKSKLQNKLLDSGEKGFKKAKH